MGKIYVDFNIFYKIPNPLWLNWRLLGQIFKNDFGMKLGIIMFNASRIGNSCV